MRIRWTKPEQQRQYSTRGVYYWVDRVEAWVNDYRIGWITVTYFRVDGDPETQVSDVSASSAVIKTIKREALYCPTKNHQQIIDEALTREHTILKEWIVQQWKSMLEKAGII